jgi:hypothetical protein
VGEHTGKAPWREEFISTPQNKYRCQPMGGKREEPGRIASSESKRKQRDLAKSFHVMPGKWES